MAARDGRIVRVTDGGRSGDVHWCDWCVAPHAVARASTAARAEEDVRHVGKVSGERVSASGYTAASPWHERERPYVAVSPVRASTASLGCGWTGAGPVQCPRTGS
jgi:hypothetical protein